MTGRGPGPAQSWDPKRYAEGAGFVSDLGAPVLGLLAPRRGERILDLGCGEGALTEKLVEAGCEVLGVDASEDQVAAARARGLNAEVADGAALGFDGRFDAVFSNAALHWMRDPDAVIRGVWRALKPGGRFVGEMGGDGNVRLIVAALMTALGRRGIDGGALNPWYFPTPEDYGRRLEAVGFSVTDIDLFSRPTDLPEAMTDWLGIFAKSFLTAVPEADQSALLHEVSDLLREDLQDREGRWRADYVRLRFRALKPA